MTAPNVKTRPCGDPNGPDGPLIRCRLPSGHTGDHDDEKYQWPARDPRQECGCPPAVLRCCHFEGRSVRIYSGSLVTDGGVPYAFATGIFIDSEPRTDNYTLYDDLDAAHRAFDAAERELLSREVLS